MSHPTESFSAAVSVLAGNGHIKQRLIKAYEENLQSIEEDQLPIPMKQRFADLRHLMQRVAPLNGEGAVCASVRKMSLDEADQCAKLMVELYGKVIRHGDGQAAKPIDSQQPVPPFLVKSG
ncbi:MAG: hypothetical protein HKN35_11585 [Woeseia sp.]|nr:hypothetical protein [Woeseia sp.]MBT8095633.1 hypothetical protein [Woeseia sp.]NNE61531.1 hypothetical protein [Woeseia sp.]NNL54127.1 hypothetical protein [Woeseia sp.]